MTPEGSVPTRDSAGVGNPVVVTVNVPAWPVVNVVLLGAGDRRGAWSTVSVKFWVASGVDAVGGGDGHGVGAAGARRRRAGEGGGAVAVVHEGDARGQRPVSVSAAVGNPVVVTVNVPACPSVNVVALALVMAGAWLTVSVKLWVASGRRRWRR